ncbi:MAG: hypothetical protein ACRENI_03825 [Gemmatimonadaceae bacterium]
MLRILAATAAACCVLGGVLAPRALAQTWNDDTTTALVERATERRAQQLADSGLTDYRATAHGYLTFLAQVGEGFTEPPRVVKADELALEVYWRAPSLSKQRIVGRRDTLLLPTDINYHRDHLGIVQNNFPSVIRLGEGDEVQDVPHPFSAAGAASYDYAINDSLALRLPNRTIDLTEVLVRPRDDSDPAVIGAAWIDRESAEIVRMAFNFTRAAFLDDKVEDISIVLENGLIQGRYWLPIRQEIEIRRTGSWLDYPARGIIRGRWEICCYEINTGLPYTLFRGPEVVQAPVEVLREHVWSGAILDSLPPDVRAVRPEEIRRVQAEARELVRAGALARTRSLSLAAGGISDFVRVNRVEGFSLGAGLTRRVGGGLSLEASARWGFADHEAKGRIALVWRRAAGRSVTLFAERVLRDAGDVAESSTLVNSIAAQEFGRDHTDPFDVRGVGIEADMGKQWGVLWSVRAGTERHDSVSVNATPALGSYEATIAALPLEMAYIGVVADRPTVLAPLGTELRARVELLAGAFRPTGALAGEEGTQSLARVSGFAELERPLGRNRLLLRAAAGWVTAEDGASANPPAQSLVYLGGSISAPGYDYHSLVGTFGAGMRAEWRSPVPFVRIPLGRFGTAPASATLAPYASAAFVDGVQGREGWYPSLGAGLLVLFDLVRLDAAHGLRDGRWSFSIDVAREFWAIL